MSFREKASKRVRSVHARVQCAHDDGSVSAMIIARATYADRQAVLSAAIRAGEVDPKTHEPVNSLAGMSFAARILARLLYEGDKRVFGESEDDLAVLMDVEHFEEWSKLAMASLAGEDPDAAKKPSAPQGESSDA